MKTKIKNKTLRNNWVTFDDYTYLVHTIIYTHYILLNFVPPRWVFEVSIFFTLFFNYLKQLSVVKTTIISMFIKKYFVF